MSSKNAVVQTSPNLMKNIHDPYQPKFSGQLPENSITVPIHSVYSDLSFIDSYSLIALGML